MMDTVSLYLCMQCPRKDAVGNNFGGNDVIIIIFMLCLLYYGTLLSFSLHFCPPGQPRHQELYQCIHVGLRPG